MAERTGPVQAQHRADQDRAQAAYARFVRHTQLCTDCRTNGVDCADAAELKESWRTAQQAVTA